MYGLIKAVVVTFVNRISERTKIVHLFIKTKNWNKRLRPTPQSGFLETMHFILFYIYLFIWLCWVLVAACGIFDFSLQYANS